MGLVPLGVVLVAMTALATSATLAPFRRGFAAHLATIEPARRTWWLGGLLSAPLIAGLGVLVLALVPSFEALLPGALDDCRAHGGVVCRLCLRHPAHATTLAWALALLCLAPVGRRVVAAARALVASRRVLVRLRPVAVRTGDARVWSVPGARSFVAGWPRGVACIGEEIGRRLGARTRTVVTAHELAHLRRGDLHLRLGARVLAATHLPVVGAWLLAELDLAVEQACDAEASRAVCDPLVVAQALIDVARLDAAAPSGLVAAFARDQLEARIAALCAPSWTQPSWLREALALALTVASGIALHHQVHHAANAIVGRLAG